MEFSKKFVCEDTRFSTYEKNVPAPIFRKSFVVETKAELAKILICGLGFYDLFINGKKITKGYLAPYISNSDHICYYDEYDILEYLKKGENVIGVMLGDGHQVGKTVTWNFRNNITNSAPLLALSAEIVCGDEVISFEADDFVCKKGPILFNDLRSGVFYDARLEEKGWTEADFCEKDWHKPIVNAYRPRGCQKICEAEPIRVYREIKPVSIKKGGIKLFELHPDVEKLKNGGEFFETGPDADGGYIYDFGENNSGIFRLKIKGTRGQKVSIQCGEQVVNGKLDYSTINFFPNGFAQRDIYYLKGDGEEIFEPMFTYHGFRYLYVSGISEEQATKDLLTYLVMSSDIERRGDFECSDDVADKIYEMARRSDISNFFYFPTDCPHREKNGWTGDAAASAEHMIMTIGVENSWREWLNNIRLAQRADGMLPGIVPTENWGYHWGNGPAWDSVLFTLPYMAYKYRGEVDIIKENAGAMLRYLEYISKRRDKKGLVAVGLGDWVPVVIDEEKYQSDVPLGFTDSVMVLDMCKKACEMFGKVNLNLHMQFAKKLGEEMLEAIRKEYINLDTYVVDKGHQTTQAMAIFYNVFKEEEKKKAFDVLMKIIEKDNFCMVSGLLGIRVIFHTLSQFGEADLAYKMITKEEYPSYGYLVKKGETTLPEQFKEYDDYYNLSKNHHLFGDVVNWFMSCPGGIKVQNSDTVVICPSFIKKLDWCKASHKLKNGEVSVFWKRKNDTVELNVKVTGDINCTVDLSNATEKVITVFERN